MSAATTDLVREYTASLREYGNSQGEAALSRAYETGRRALAEGLGVLDMVAAHRAAVAERLDTFLVEHNDVAHNDVAHNDAREIDPAEIHRAYHSALSCFAESLSPFEMALRGVQEANARLQETLDSLENIEGQLREQNRELIAAHRAVEEERGRYHALFDFAPDGYLVTGPEGAIREVNAAAAVLLNTPQGNLPGQSLIEFVETSDRETFRNELRALHLGTVDRVEDWQVSIRPRNKPSFPATLTVVAERVLPVFASLRWLIRDATGRKRLEKEKARALIARTKAQEARRFEFLANASSLLVESLDIEACLRNVVRLTGAFLSSWCFMAVTGPGGSLRQVEVGHGEVASTRLENALRRHCLFSGHGTAQSDLLLAGPQLIEPLTAAWIERAADSPQHAVILRELCGSCAIVFPLRIHNRLMGVLTLISPVGSRRFRPADRVLCEDLARRCALALENVRLYREMVAERDKAERASRTKDEFVAILGHELRNPLTPVIGWTRILKNHPLILQDPVLAEGVQAVERNASMLTRLVGGCADLAKISEGKIPVERAPVDLNHIVVDSVEAIRDLAGEHGLEINVEVAEPPAIVWGDDVRLTQVVMNLLNNAVKYTPDGGQVSIRTKCVGHEAEIEIQDTGTGIDPAFIEQIFEPFRQGNSSWLTSTSGLGLGLAIARRIVAIHGGRIWAESQGLGTGSIFRVRLPSGDASEQHWAGAASGEREDIEPSGSDRPALDGALPAVTDSSSTVSPPASNGPASPGGGRRILLIEDSADILFLMKLELERMGHSVITAANGRSGMELARTDPPDLILSDIKMPLVDGYKLIRAIRQTPELSGIPAIALTGLGARAEMESALAAGFNACISKPAEPEQIAALIQQLTGFESAARPEPPPFPNAPGHVQEKTS